MGVGEVARTVVLGGWSGGIHGDLAQNAALANLIGLKVESWCPVRQDLNKKGIQMVMFKPIIAVMLSFAVSMFYAGLVCGQNYPNKPIRIVTAEPGSANDFAARLIAQGLTASLGQQVIVENRSGDMPGAVVAKAVPDGYTLLVYGGGIWLLPLLRKSVPWDFVRDFSPVTLVMRSPNVLVVHPSVPVHSVQELIALTKAKPGELNYGSGAIGTSPDLAARLFTAMAGVNIVRINYRGTGPAVMALLGGQVQMIFTSTASIASHVKAGKVRALAVTSAEPSPLAPGLPTMATSGVPGYELTSKWAMFAPAGTPMVIINLLNREVARILTKTEVKERLFSNDAEAAGGSPEEFAATVKADIAKWSKLIRDEGIKAEE
jgi:tripartite-type tricarboxylate transporter receptor subunit TctC